MDSYFCVTWFIYEFLLILSIVAYVDVFMTIQSLREYIEAMWHMRLIDAICISCFMMNWTVFILYWKNVSLIHRSLHRLIAYRIRFVSKFEDKLLHNPQCTLSDNFLDKTKSKFASRSSFTISEWKTHKNWIYQSKNGLDLAARVYFLLHFLLYHCVWNSVSWTDSFWIIVHKFLHDGSRFVF